MNIDGGINLNLLDIPRFVLAARSEELLTDFVV